MDKVLIVVDMQNDFIDGSLGTPEAQAIVDNVVAKIEEYRKENDTIYFTKDTHDNSYTNTLESKYLPIEHCIYDTHGWNLCDAIENECKRSDGIVLLKYTFGFSYWESYLERHFINTIEICGLCTDICVVSNALILRALYPNLEIVCDASCCVGTTPERHKEALDVMRSCQIQVINDD